jgi:hypothetical protein
MVTICYSGHMQRTELYSIKAISMDSAWSGKLVEDRGQAGVFKIRNECRIPSVPSMRVLSVTIFSILLSHI